MGVHCLPDSGSLDLQSHVSVGSWNSENGPGLVVLMEGHNHVVYTQEEGSGTRLIIDHQSFVFPAAVDPSVLKAEVAGKLMRYLVREGDAVEIGTPVAELEVMSPSAPISSAFGRRRESFFWWGKRRMAGESVQCQSDLGGGLGWCVMGVPTNLR